MFGYVSAPLARLTGEQLERYRSAYCGLCRSIGHRHGQAARLSLTYDLTFLTLLLQSLYEPAEEHGEGRCLPHPVKARQWHISEATDYAADLTVILTHFKCEDDWTDDHSLKARGYDQLLRRDLPKLQKTLPRQWASVEQHLHEYEELQKQGSSGGQLCGCFGQLMGELFVWKQDEWANTLRSMGQALGEFICLMDASMDYEDDLKRGNPNALHMMRMDPRQAREPLQMLMGRVTMLFEKLPLVQDIDLLRSILYSGIWQQYDAMLEKKYGITTPGRAEGD